LIDWPAVRQATRTIPIVFVGISDPVSVAGWSFPDLPMRGRVEVDRRSRGDTVFTIDKRSEKGFWTTVGAVWAHQDGKGLTVRLNLVPVGGHDIVIRKSKPKATTDQTDDDIPLELAQRAALPSAALFHERATALAGGAPRLALLFYRH
jgi:hypothetical protein